MVLLCICIHSASPECLCSRRLHFSERTHLLCFCYVFAYILHPQSASAVSGCTFPNALIYYCFAMYLHTFFVVDFLSRDLETSAWNAWQEHSCGQHATLHVCAPGCSRLSGFILIGPTYNMVQTWYCDNISKKLSHCLCYISQQCSWKLGPEQLTTPNDKKNV